MLDLNTSHVNVNQEDTYPYYFGGDLNTSHVNVNLCLLNSLLSVFAI